MEETRGERILLTSIVIRKHNEYKSVWKVYVADKEYIDSAMRYESPHQSAWGLTESLDKAIYLLKGMYYYDLRSTVFHEISHAICFDYGVHFDMSDSGTVEETMCDFIGTHWDTINDKGKSVVEAYKNAGYIRHDYHASDVRSGSNG